MTQLVCDSGSTKATWCLVSDNSKKEIYKTEGFNPYFVTSDQIIQSLQYQLLKELDANSIDKVFFYGAGCSSVENNLSVSSALKKCFPNAEINVDHDLLAAARALLFDKKGFASILGTGTNSAIYDGKDIVSNIDSLGYFLGDEGSGSYLGKKLLRDHLRNYLPRELNEKFKEICELNKEQIFYRLYNQPLPNRFLASFAIFFGQNKEHEYCQRIVKEGFDDFFENLVSGYSSYKNYSFNCVGSIAYSFQDILTQTANKYEMPMGIIIRSPIDRLVEYHEKFI